MIVCGRVSIPDFGLRGAGAGARAWFLGRGRVFRGQGSRGSLTHFLARNQCKIRMSGRVRSLSSVFTSAGLENLEFPGKNQDFRGENPGFCEFVA